MASVWRRIVDKVKASAMTNLLMCEYFVTFLLPLGNVYAVSLSHVKSFKLHVIISGFIKCSSSVCCFSYYSSAGGLNIPRLCNWFLFKFLWISAGPTYSALPVNAKEVSGDVCFIQKLLFHCCSLIMDFRCSCTCSRFSGSELCLLSIFTHSCVYLAFRYSLTKLHGMGVATSWWARTPFMIH